MEKVTRQQYQDEVKKYWSERCNKLQKQSDLLTLGLVQEKNKVAKLYDALTLILNENFSGQSTLSPYAKRQADEALDYIANL